MTEPKDLPGPAARPLRRALRLTRAGMIAERLARAFWPLAALAMAILAALMFGLQDILPLEVFWVAAVAGLLGLVAALVWGIWKFRLPRWDEAMGRLDATLPGRPISAITDRQAIGSGDAASEAIWRAHVARMAERVRRARAVRPDLRIASRDPFALRYVALVALVMALLFGSVWRVASVAGMAPGGAGTQAATAAWEGWVEPPAYTGKPSLYLADQAAGTLRVPQGSLVTIRLYGEVGRLLVEETVSGRTEPGSASETVQSFEVTQPGRIAIRGPGGREWDVAVLPDQPPTIQPDGEAERTVQGEMRMNFTASDDNGVVAARARIELDTGALDRRYGLSIDPEPRDPILVDLPLSVAGDRRAVAETITEDFSQHPWALLPVTITLTALDAAEQEGSSDPAEIVLPGRRFFDVMAKALIENRRDLLWSRDNAPRVAQVMRAVSWQPDTAFDQPGLYLKVRAVIRRIEAELETGPLTDEFRDEVVQILWDLAVEIEDGTLENALERMREAQERLAEAIRNGATPEEIQKLMDELRAATDNYIEMLAERAPEDGTDQPDQQGQGQMMSGDQLEEMMQELQRLMEEGKTAEAQALLEQLQQLMENMQVTRAPGQGGPGQESMDELADTLREQQELSDDTFGDLNGQPQGEQGQEGGEQGQGGQQQPGQQGQGQQGEGRRGQQPGQGQGGGRDGTRQGQGQSGQSQQEQLAERQRALRDMLEGQERSIPGAGTESGDAARDAIGRSGEAMDRAEDALRDGDLSGALDQQAEAMEALREGMRQLGDMMAENQQQQPGQGQQGDQVGQANGPGGSRDPLGRDPSGNGQIRSDETMLRGEDVYRRAQDLLEELRRRAGDQGRSAEELDYLKRLLERF